MKEISDERQRSESDSNFVTTKNLNNKFETTDVDQRVVSYVGGEQKTNAYITTLKKYEEKTANNDNEKPIITGHGDSLFVEAPIIHDASRIINNVFNEYFRCDLPNKKTELFDSPALNERSIEEDDRYEKVNGNLVDRYDRTAGLTKYWNDGGLFMSVGCSTSEETKRRIMHEKPVYYVRDDLKRLRSSRRRPETVRYATDVNRTRLVPVIDETRLVLNTEFVGFDDCVPGGVYRKTATITNAGKRSASFKIIKPVGSYATFEYDYTPMYPIAPGLNAKLTVTYRCTSLAEMSERIIILANDNKTTQLVVYVENPTPVLTYVLECFDADDDCGRLDREDVSTICVFECNACLAGAVKNVTVRIKNVGRPAKFVCVSEDVWYTTPIECSRFIIVSDNWCAHEVNVFGDGVTFDHRSVHLEGQGLRRCGSEPERYALDMGRIGEVVRFVYVKNTSRVVYWYRWIVNHAIVKSNGTETARVNFNVHPSTGLLDKASETMFRMECGVTDRIVTEQLTGEYRVIATMMIDGIPKKSLSSISNQDIVFEEQEDNPEMLSVKIAEIEVTAKYKGKERISLCIDPIVVDLSWYNLNTDVCVQHAVEFANADAVPIRVSWTPDAVDAAEPASVWVAPGTFDVPARAATRVHVRVEPIRAGTVRRTLRFRAERRTGDTATAVVAAVYVRGAVEPSPAARVRPTAAVVAPGPACAGVPLSYGVRLRPCRAAVGGGGPFRVRGAHYELDASGTLRPRPGAVGGDYGEAADLRFRVPVGTEAAGVTCQLTEWWLTAVGVADVPAGRTRVAAYVQPPAVRLNVDAVTVTGPLYKGACHRHAGVRLVNDTACDQVYAWAGPVGKDAGRMDALVRPAGGTVAGRSSVHFELFLTPRNAGHLNDYRIPCFVQCDGQVPKQISVKCRVKEFSATITYADGFGVQRDIIWRQNLNQWITRQIFAEKEQTENEYSELENDSTSTINEKSSTDSNIESLREHEIEPEDCDELEWPVRDARRFGKESCTGHATIAFENVECNTAMKRRVTVRNTTGIPCRVKSSIAHHNQNGLKNEKTLCTIWIKKDDQVLDGQSEFDIYLWALVTAWGQYHDLLNVEFLVGADVLPAVRIPLIVSSVTFPIEFPLATDVNKPAVEFSLYSVDTEHRMQVLNNSGIPVQISWRTYNKCENEIIKPFGVLLDILTPDVPGHWTLRIGRYHGKETPRYFKIKPLILKLEPKELGFVTFFLDRTKEVSICRNNDNIVYGKAIGTVTALETHGEHCVRLDGFQLKSAVVELRSETRHSIRPNFVLREPDNVFKVSAAEIYRLHLPNYTVTRSFTLLNLLRYPATVSFGINQPFTVTNLRTLRCGSRPGNAWIRVFYKDLVEIELEALVSMRTIPRPKMPASDQLSRKYEQIEHLYAICKHGYSKPKAIATFEVHVHFPVLKLSTDRIDFGQVAVNETKSVDVIVSSYPGPERFTVHAKHQEIFMISPTDGVASRDTPATITVTFRPTKIDERYSSKIEISSTVFNDVIFTRVSGIGIE